MPYVDEGSWPSKKKEAQFQIGRLVGKINRKISAGEEFNSILDFLYDSLRGTIPFDRMGIALVEGDRICSKWIRSELPGSNLGPGYYGLLKGSSLNQILASGEPRIINDLVQYSHSHPKSESTKLAIKDGVRSSLSCPIYSGGVPTGIVFFSSGQTDTYTSEHIETYLEIADELSFVIDQESVRKEAQRGKASGQNVRMLLHDLKSPLGVIQGFLEIAKDEAWYQTLGKDAKSIFETLQRNAFHMNDLLNELAELNQLTVIGNRMNVTEVNLKTFISEVVDVGREMALRKEIAFEAECGSDLPSIVAFDTLKIRRAIENLLSNAIKYSARLTSVHLLVKYTDGRIRFEVRDQGQGIPSNEFSKLFQEFGKTSVRPTEGESSSGIGLAIVKKIVEQHDGQVFVHSEIGIGSRFGFWIPISKI